MDELAMLKSSFEKHQNTNNAEPMKKYMKNHFPFLGIKSPLRKALESQFFKESGILKGSFNHELVVRLWDEEEREYQYTALQYIVKCLKKLKKTDIELLETLILTKSWWDTVDTLASYPVGEIARRFPETVDEKINTWAEHDDLWLRRTAILFQLKYKQETNEELLYQYISQNAESKEFFIQKAIGWALREYSKTNPASVKSFIAKHKLAPLSVREGQRYLL